MPTKEEVQKVYRNLNRLIKAVQEDKNIPEWRKMPIIDQLLDRKLEIQKWLVDYLEDEDCNDPLKFLAYGVKAIEGFCDQVVLVHIAN